MKSNKYNKLLETFNNAQDLTQKTKSLTVTLHKETDDCEPYISFCCVIYRYQNNAITEPQLRYLTRLSDYKSKSNLRWLNKYAAMNIITIIKESGLGPECFYVSA